MTIKEGLVLIAGALAGAAVALGVAYLLVGLRITSPDNVAAGAVVGFTGPVIGLLAALAFIICNEDKEKN